MAYNPVYGPPLVYSDEKLRVKFYTIPHSKKLREAFKRLAEQVSVQTLVYSDEKLKVIFDESDHPRGQPGNAGQFREKEKAAPGIATGGKREAPNDKHKRSTIPEELFSEDTVIDKKPKPAPLIEKIFSIKQGKPAAIGHALQAVNPNFGSNKQDTLSKISYEKNCQNSTVAYELQRRGYDVTAMPHSGQAENGELRNAFEVFDLEDKDYQQATRGKNDLEKELRKSDYPNGARFVISQELKVRGKSVWHNYIAEKIGGIINYIDPQKGKSDASALLKKVQIRAGKYQLFFARVDDKPLKEGIDFTKAVKATDSK